MVVEPLIPDFILSWRGTSTSTPTAITALAPAWPSAAAVKRYEVRYFAGLAAAFYAVTAGTTGNVGIVAPNTAGGDYTDTGSTVTWRRVPSRLVTVANEDGSIVIRVGGLDMTATVGGIPCPAGGAIEDIAINDPAKLAVYSASSAALSVWVRP